MIHREFIKYAIDPALAQFGLLHHHHARALRRYLLCAAGAGSSFNRVKYADSCEMRYGFYGETVAGLDWITTAAGLSAPWWQKDIGAYEHETGEFKSSIYRVQFDPVWATVLEVRRLQLSDVSAAHTGLSPISWEREDCARYYALASHSSELQRHRGAFLRHWNSANAAIKNAGD